MKKLKFMLAAATALGFAAVSQATDYDGSTDFESISLTDSLFQFTGSEGDNESEIVSGSTDYSGTRPRKYANDSASTKYLKVSTGTDPLLRKFSNAETVAVPENGLYIDTLVQFTVTPAADDVTTNENDKLLIYLKEDGNGTTNLMVKAAFYQPEDPILMIDETLEPRDVVVSAAVVPGQWYRLTVKSILVKDTNEDDFLAFKIWLDGVPLTVPSASGALYSSDLTLFPSLLGKAVKRLAAVGFAGEGQVDDLAMTDEDPLATSYDFTLTLGEGVSAVTFTIAGGSAITKSGAGSQTWKVYEGQTIAIEAGSPVYATGYMAGTVTPSGFASDYTVGTANCSLEFTALTEPAVTAVGGVTYTVANGVYTFTAPQGSVISSLLVDGVAVPAAVGQTSYEWTAVGGTTVSVTAMGAAADHPWFESPGAVVLAENLPGQTGNIVSAFHGQGSGNFLGLTYSTNPLQFDLFGVDGTNALTTIHSVAAGDVTDPGFRGVAISETLGVAMTLAYAKTTTMYTFALNPTVGGNSAKAVTKSSDYGFDAAAFSPDGSYLFSNIVAGPEGNTHYAKWAVSVDANTGALSLTKVGTKAAGGRGRSVAYARINGRDLVFGLVDAGKVVVMDMTDADPANWTAADLITDLPVHSYGTLCVSGVNVYGGTPHLTVATANNNGATKGDVLNVYALTVPASGTVGVELTKSFDEDALTAAGFGDISDANRYGNTVYVTDDESTIYFARPDNKLYAGQFAYVVNFVVDGVTNSVPVFPGATVAQADPTKENYVFDGWFAPGASEAYDLSTPVTQDITLTAQFTAAEAKIGADDFYRTLQAAVDAASAGDTVTVLADCTISTSLSIAKNITVHNDHTITGAVNYAICIGAAVTFEGSGKIERASGITGSAFCVGANETTRGAITAGTAGTLNFDGLTVCGGSGGNLIKLENGTVNMNGGVLKDGLRGIKADADAGNYTSAIVINGGTITNCSGCAVMASAASANGTATVVVNGGEIAGSLVYDGTAGTHSITIPGTSTAKFNADQSAFCEAGYETTLVDGWYVVTAVQQAGWVDDSSTVSNETAGAAYSALAGTALADADAQKLTDWAKANSVAFNDATTSAASYVDAFMLNCAPTAEAVAAAEEAFKLGITFDANGTPVVTVPTGYNVTPQLKGSNDLTTWTDVEAASTSYKFYKCELSL